MRQSTLGYLVAIAMLAAATTAEAATIPITSVTPTVLFADFNVIVQNNLSTSNDIGGPIMVGCPAAGCVATQGLHATAGPLNSKPVVLGTTAGTTGVTGYGEIDVFSNVLAGTNAIVHGLTLVGGTNSGTLLGAGAGSILGGYAFPNGALPANNPTTFQTFIWSPLKTVSTSLGALSSPSSVTGTVNPAFTGVANAAGQVVFNLTLAQLNSYSGTLSFQGCLAANNPGGPCDGVINVTDATGTLTQGFAFPLVATGFPNLIVNFEGNVTANVSNVWTASILDPLGMVNATTDITGDVFAQNYTTSAETHFAPFDCSDNLCAGMSFPPLPEPGTLPLLASAFAAFAGLAAIRRRRV